MALDRSDVNPAQYETQLSPEEDKKFWTWLDTQHTQKHIGDGDYNYYKQRGYGYDYDFRAAYVDKQQQGDNGHWNDIGKKPNHPTFSVESKYAKDAPGYAGHWEGDLYVPPVNEKHYIPEVHDGQ